MKPHAFKSQLQFKVYQNNCYNNNDRSNSQYNNQHIVAKVESLILRRRDIGIVCSVVCRVVCLVCGSVYNIIGRGCITAC